MEMHELLLSLTVASSISLSNFQKSWWLAELALVGLAEANRELKLSRYFWSLIGLSGVESTRSKAEVRGVATTHISVKSS